MKKILLAAALTVAAASPVFAQSYDPDLGSGNITQYYDNGNNLVPNPSPGAYGAGPYYGYYTQVPGGGPGHRAPYARYDGRLIDENRPDLW